MSESRSIHVKYVGVEGGRWIVCLLTLAVDDCQSFPSNFSFDLFDPHIHLSSHRLKWGKEENGFSISMFC